jgi:carboxymethylenebutenolidase
MGNMIEVNADEVVDAYLAMPDSTPKGAIIVIHEVWGLMDHIKSIAHRFAKEGYIALAPELLKVLDLKSDEATKLQQDLFNPETRNNVQPRLRELMAPIQEPEFGEKTAGRIKACFDYLYNLPEANKSVAIIGYCFGGTYSFALATKEPRLKIALPFYGHSDQPVEELKNIKCPVRAFYGENDENLMSKLPDLKQRMADAGVDFESKVYPDAGHAFFNDSNPYAYNEAAAKDAWTLVKEDLSSAMSSPADQS